jgi:hypothetical protein
LFQAAGKKGRPGDNRTAITGVLDDVRRGSRVKEPTLLTSTPSRSHRSAARTTLIVLLVLVVVGVLVGVGYAATHGGSHPRATLPINVASTVTSAVVITTTPAPATPAPATTTLPADVVKFVALPVGMPPTPGASESDYPWHRLVATLTGPAKVQAGDSLDYRVRLTNRTAEAIPLSPCPAYDLSVGLRTMSYGLNCADAPTSAIEPGASMSFDLPVSISRSLSSGTRTDVAWSLGWQPDRTSPQDRLSVTVR